MNDSMGRPSYSKANEVIRRRSKEKRIPLWRVADACGLSETRFFTRMRYELPDDEQKRIMQIIDQLAESREKTYAGN